MFICVVGDNLLANAFEADGHLVYSAQGNITDQHLMAAIIETAPTEVRNVHLVLVGDGQKMADKASKFSARSTMRNPVIRVTTEPSFSDRILCVPEEDDAIDTMYAIYPLIGLDIPETREIKRAVGDNLDDGVAPVIPIIPSNRGQAVQAPPRVASPAEQPRPARPNLRPSVASGIRHRKPPQRQLPPRRQEETPVEETPPEPSPSRSLPARRPLKSQTIRNPASGSPMDSGKDRVDTPSAPIRDEPISEDTAASTAEQLPPKKQEPTVESSPADDVASHGVEENDPRPGTRNWQPPDRTITNLEPLEEEPEEVVVQPEAVREDALREQTGDFFESDVPDTRTSPAPAPRPAEQPEQTPRGLAVAPDMEGVPAPAYKHPTDSNVPHSSHSPELDPMDNQGYGATPWAAEDPTARKRLKGQVISVCAAKGGVGKSTSTLWLAETITASGLSACVVDANVAQPDLLKIVGKWNPKIEGLMGIVTPIGEKYTPEALDDAIVKIPYLGDMLPGPPNPILVDQEPAFRALRYAIEDLKTRYDWVIVDTPVATVWEPAMLDVMKPTSDFVLVVTTPHLPTAQDTEKWLKDAGKPIEQKGLDMPYEKFIGLVNSSDDKTGVSVKDLQDWLPMLAMSAHIPKIPAVTSNQNKKQWRCPAAAREGMIQLVHTLCGGASPIVPSVKKGKGQKKGKSRFKLGR